MMMPANYSAVAENELSYVIGGGLADVLATPMGTAQWKNFSTNLVTIIGNTYMSKFIKNTLGVVFSGTYVPGNVTTGVTGKLSDIYDGAKAAVLEGMTKPEGKDDYSGWQKFLAGSDGVLNSVLGVVGGMAAVYNLGFGTVKNAAATKAWDING